MASITTVNSQITDSVSQVNTKVLGDAPAVGMGNLLVASSQALSNSAHNAAFNQNQTGLISQTSMNQGVSTLLSLDIASNGVATTKIFGVGQPNP